MIYLISYFAAGDSLRSTSPLFLPMGLGEAWPVAYSGSGPRMSM